MSIEGGTCKYSQIKLVKLNHIAVYDTLYIDLACYICMFHINICMFHIKNIMDYIFRYVNINIHYYVLT